MYDGIMRETFWAKPQTTIEMFTIKKHMQQMPEFQDKSLSTLSKQEYEVLTSSEWAQLLKEKRP